ncbi:MAG: phage tail tape measure protein [Flavobacteriaceae bacterium]
MPIQVPVVQTGLEQSIQQAAAKAGKNLRINMGPGAKSIESLSKPLGRLTGKADEFTKSMEAANARVLAFGASVGVIAAVSRGLQELVKTTIEVEKSLANINSILRQTESQLDSFKNQIFDIARNTGQTFDTVAEAALELSRQGLKAEEVTKRLNDALVLSRLSGLSAADSVAGLTAAVNSFSSAGLTTTEVLNKISAAAASAAVSDRDLIEGLKRSGAVAVASGVQFDELIGIISALQERTARGGAVIGNSLKTIFTRIQDIEKLKALQNLGVQVTDLEGKVLSSNKVIENLAPTFAKLDQAAKVNLADNLVGKFQIAPFLALLEDYNLKVSRSGEVAATSFNATNEAYQRNEALSKTLANAVNVATVNLKELANTLGEIGVTDSLKNIIGVFNSVVSSIQDVLDGDGIGSQFAKGLIKGISTIISGPGLALALVAIGKLLLDFAKFGAGALKTFFGLNKAAEAQKNLQGQIAASLLNDKGIRSAILSIEKQNISEGEKKKLQTQFFTKALNEQLMVMQKMQGIARTIAPGVMAGTASRRGKRAAGGFLPIGAESSDISRGVGGAPASAKPVVIPNFAFGGGKRGTMVANDSEYIVPNYANGGDAIFNQNMASSMGLPANARKVRAASGYIPNFVNEDEQLVLFAGDRGADFKKVFHVGKTKTNETKAYASKASAPKGMRTKPVTVPAYRMKGGKGDAAPQDIEYIKKRLSESSSGTALKFAKDLSGKTKLPDLSKKRIQSLFNPGAFEGMSGSIFEVAISSILKSREFLDYASRHTNARIDLPYSERLFSKFGAVGKGKLGAEVKANSGLAASAAIKFYDVLVGGEQVATYDKNRFLGKTLKKSEFQKIYKNGIEGKGYDAVKRILGGTVTRGGAQNLFARSASGYIPNFAEGALEDAIGRERAAGLPVSQIRINQSGKLRNAQNPMGLAVTNTRDEPTGAIPNYAAERYPAGTVIDGKKVGGQFKKAGDAAEKSSKAVNKSTSSFDKNSGMSDGLTNKFFAVQGAMTIFGSMAGEAGGALGEFTQAAMTSAQIMLGLQAFGVSPGLSLGNKFTAGRRRVGVTNAVQGFSSGKGGPISKLFSKLGPVSKAFGKMGPFLGKVVGGLGRFVPILGTVLTLFPLINAGFKKLFGEGIFSKVGKFLGLIQTPAEKASKALGELADQTLKNLAVGANPFRDFQFELEKKLAKESGDSSIRGDENKREYLLKKAARGFLDLNVLEGQGRQTKTFKNVVRRSGGGGKRKEVISSVPDQTFLQGTSQFRITGVEDSKIQEEANKVRANLLGAILAGLDEKEFEDLFKDGNVENIRKRAEKEFKSFDEKTQKQILDRAVDIVGASFEGGQKAQLLPTKVIADLIQKTRIEKQVSNNVATDLSNKTREPVFDQAFLNKLKAEERIRKSINKSEERFFTQNQKFNKELLELSGKINLSKEERVKQESLINKKLELQKKRQSDSLSSIKEFEEDLKELSKNKIFDKGEEQFIESIMSKISDFNLETDEGLENLRKFKENLEGDLQASFIKEITGDTENFQEKLETLQPAIQALIASLDASEIEGENIFERFKKTAEDAFKLSRKTRGRQATESFNEFLSSEGLSSAREAEDARMSALSPEQLRINRRLNVLSQPVLNQTEMGGVRVSAESNELQRQSKILELEREKTRLQTQQKRIIEDFFIKKEGIQNLDAREIENRLETLNIHKFLEGLNEKELNIINNKQTASKIEISQLEEKLRLTKETSSQEEKILEQIKKRGPLGYGFVTGFAQDVTDAESNAVNLGKELGDASAKFAYNIGNAMLDAIQKGENLGDVLLGTAAEFLNLISRAFMKSAVNDLLGSFGVGKQGGGPISGGSGTKDDVPAMLMGGEFVMNKKAVRKYGMGFMSALNNGSLQGFASGGQVKDREGMFTTPGMNGAGAIKGAANLLSFATQTPVALNRDTITSSGAFLDAESGRMTMFGRRNNPQFQSVQDAKRQAFDLYASEMNARQQAIEQEKANKKALIDGLKSAAISAVVGAGMKSMSAGFKAGFSGTEGSFGAKLGAGLKGTIFGGNEFGGETFGGLKNLFSNRRFDSGIPQATPVTSIPQATPFTPKSTFEDLYQGARLGGKMTVLPKLAATGGLIPAAGGVDTVPAMLSGGEFVMNAAATRNIGAGNLQALNSGAGVDNTDLVSKLDELILATEASQSTGEINITVNGSNGTDTQTSGQDTTDQQRQLSERIKVAVKQVIADEQRLGGQLRR